MTDKPLPVVRCAIYTRKSSDEGLDQPHTSLDAQRDACKAYVLSQQHQGWRALETIYDDGGFSGGNLARPGLTALLADIKAGRIDVVVVYKIDRLTRALLDFVKIVEILDAAGASFVSVTQSFNTTSSMGRLTLNVLLSFAQFEREIAGERIRDKFASTRAKGLWVGSRTPLGYERRDGVLAINPAEAEVIRTIFQQYIETQNLSAVVQFCAENGLLTRGAKGAPGQPVSHASVANILKNPVYIGKLRHAGAILPGSHKGIVTPEIFDQAAALLEMRQQSLLARRVEPPPHLLEGLLRTAAGEMFQGVQAKTRLCRGRTYELALAKGWTQRINAQSLDTVVVNAVTGFLAELVEAGGPDTSRAVSSVIQQFRTRKLAELRERLAGLVDYIILNETTMALTIRLRAAPLGGSLSADTDLVAEIGRHTTRSVSRVFADGGQGKPDMRLVTLISRGCRWFNELLSDREATIAAIARREGFSACYVGTTMDLAFLAPDLKREILEGRHPRGLTGAGLLALCPLPQAWDRQRRLLETATVPGKKLKPEGLRALKGPMIRRPDPGREQPRRRRRNAAMSEEGVELSLRNHLGPPEPAA